jgi:hypothetical protein
MRVSRIGYWSSVPVSQEWNFHPDRLYSSINLVPRTKSENNKRRNRMYAIMGTTGRVGGAIAENLYAQGEQIRAIIRNPEKATQWRDRRAEIALADFDDPNALASAFEGTDGVFLMVPPNFAPAPGFPETRKTLAS